MCYDEDYGEENIQAESIYDPYEKKYTCTHTTNTEFDFYTLDASKSKADGYARMISSEAICIEFSGKIFVHTECSKEDEIDRIIIANGGEVKSSVVLKTDYLIIGDKISYQTKKISRAIELNTEKGKSIQAITESQFWDAVNSI